jgi:uncharacterized membrane protein
MVLVLLGTSLLFIYFVPGLILLALAMAGFLPGMLWVFLWPRRLREQAFGEVPVRDSAIQMLRERYVNGEITKVEFFAKMKDLQEQA